MLKQMVLGLGLAFAVSAVALADNAPAPPPTTMPAETDSHLAAAVELLEAQNTKSTMKTMVDVLMSAAETTVRATHPDLSNDKLRLFTDAFREEMDRSLDDLLKMQAKVYVEHFSESELRALTAFYRSDVGRKYISEVPEIMKETAPLGIEWGQTIAPLAIKRALDRLKKEGVQL
jgi:hypothetical protein